MKRQVFFIVLILSVINDNMLAQIYDNNIFIKGYLVYTCKKEDVLFLYEQEAIKAKAEITGTKTVTKYNACLRCGKYFEPLQIGDNKVDTSTVLSNLRYNNIADTATFIFIYDYDMDGCLECTESEKNGIAIDKLKLSVADRFALYYDCGEKLKRLIYIEGYAKCFDKQTYLNDPKARFYFNDHDVFYLITKITNYSTIIDLPGLNVWYPYLDQ